MTSPLLPTYARADLAFERGDGAWLTAEGGERYLDFGSGIAVNALGHAHPHLVAALTEQAGRLWHVSNLFRIPEGERLAQRLVDTTFADVAFFANSGAEANEAAIKMARKYHAVNGAPERFRIVTVEGAFHGRTLATIAAGGQQKYLEGFGPKVEGFDQVPFGDHDALRAAIGPETAAVMVEPIQAEGGVRAVPTQCLRGMRELCDERGLLLILDEVQTGVGRTGKLFAHERSGIAPDIMSVAKGIGGGFPLGVCLATAEAAKGMTVGTHGTTFGGNPLAMAVGNAVLDVVLAPGFLASRRAHGDRLKQRLAELKDRHPRSSPRSAARGCSSACAATSPTRISPRRRASEGLLTVPAGDNVVRLMPPLVIGEEEIREAFGRLDRAATALEGEMRAMAQRGAAE